MSSNYPPGVTGSEPQIAGDAAWETWADSLRPGDPLVVEWQCMTWRARFRRGDDSGVEVLLEAAAGTLVPMVVGWEDVGPPDVSDG